MGPLPPTDGQENLKDCFFGGGGTETPMQRGEAVSLPRSLSQDTLQNHRSDDDDDLATTHLIIVVLMVNSKCLALSVTPALR